jgi:hypothetical protein
MPTYYVTAEPIPEQSPDLRSCPLLPFDVVADNEAEAVEHGQMIVDDDAHRRWKAVLLGMEGIDELEDDLLNDEDAAEAAVAYVDQWRVVAKLVDRSPVEIKRVERKVDTMRDGQAVGTAPDYTDLSFDVLIGGVLCGQITRRFNEPQGAVIWYIVNPEGPLIGLGAWQWPDETASDQALIDWPHAAVAQIRASLEAGRVKLGN